MALLQGVDLFAAAVATLLVAHVVRCIRWATLFPSLSHVRHSDLLTGLSVGYLVNALLPFRVGELIRILYVHWRGKVQLAYVVATVVLERVLDILVVGAILFAFAAAGRLPWSDVMAVIIGLGAVGGTIAFGISVPRSRRVRRLVWTAASIFNSKIKFLILDSVWTFGSLLSSRRYLSPRFLMLTAVMWAVYLVSYGLFAEAVQVGFIESTYLLLGSPLSSLVEQLVNADIGNGLLLGLLILAYTSLPILGVITYGLVRDRPAIVGAMHAAHRYGFIGGELYRIVSTDKFRRASDYELFLTALFGDEHHLVSDFGLSAIDDAVVHRLLHGGSDAITAVVESDGRLIIRKFAVCDAAEKLRVQADWLNAHRGALRTVDIIEEHQGQQFYRYDMPYLIDANDFYDVIHMLPFEKSVAILDDVITQLDAFHRAHDTGLATEEQIAQYLEVKVARNAKIILDFARSFLEGPVYTINETAYDLADWARLTDRAWLRSQISDDRSAILHGDLTIENIIVRLNHAPSWYLIDPNPENIFNSPLIDWAKMMQSLNLGYEGLNRASPVTVIDNAIRLSVTKSHAYQLLHERFVDILQKKLGADGLREIHFHELANYMRLTPYKIRQNPEKGMTFFACSSILLSQYLERYAK
ncbi:MAG: flippase-like domain-containing protein [Methylacidiphilales bacterium]|nr:flippase-like domain-containing protein [Candidatus Methylacidiphilales bacterium]